MRFKRIAAVVLLLATAIAIRPAAAIPYAFTGPREILVDPNGVFGKYKTLQAAFTYIASVPATQAAPWTVRLLAGTYLQSAPLQIPSWTTIQGGGRDVTVIERTTALTNSFTAGAGVSTDPVIYGSSVAGLRLQDLTVRHAGAWASGKNSTALALLDATYFQADNVRIESTMWGVALAATNVPSPQAEATNHYFSNCFLKVDNTGTATSNDTMINTNADVYVYDSYVTLIGTSTSSSDVIRHTGGRLVLKGTDVVHRMTSTVTGSIGCLAVTGSTSDTEIRLQGSRFLMDLSGGDFNSASADVSCTDYRNSLSSGDLNFYAQDTFFDYLTGTVTAARVVAGIKTGQTFTNATKGNYYLVGSRITDLGGSGGTIRAGVVIDAVSSHIIKQFRLNGSTVTSFDFRLSSPPTITYSNYIVTESSLSRQSGTSTLSSGTATVTLDKPYPASVTDYRVAVSCNVNETFYITGKTNAQFVINSSNAGSTAVCDWTVTR